MFGSYKEINFRMISHALTQLDLATKEINFRIICLTFNWNKRIHAYWSKFVKNAKEVPDNSSW